MLLDEIIGRHGQELIDEGQGHTVLRLIGNHLAQLQVLDPSVIPGLTGVGGVIVHGDFGPQNILCSLDLTHVSGVLDWELAQVGAPIEDLAWTGVIIRVTIPTPRTTCLNSLRHLVLVQLVGASGFNGSAVPFICRILRAIGHEGSRCAMETPTSCYGALDRIVLTDCPCLSQNAWKGCPRRRTVGHFRTDGLAIRR